MKKFVLLIALAILLSIGAIADGSAPCQGSLWHDDILDGYQARTVDQGTSFDGKCVSTIVRRLAPNHSHKAFLYIHGFNDYFFQKEMGDRFVDSGYNFYAVDLRRYGRSLRDWQYPFNVRDIKEYFADIDSALVQIRRDGNTDITLGGHSTGGLTTSYFVANRGARCGVNRLVTDSPFLEWNFSAMYRKALIPMVSLWGRMAKDSKIKQSHCDGYAQSLLKEYHGEWNYNTDWKMIYSPDVTASWIHVINNTQGRLMKEAQNITIPVLVMHSDTAIHGCSWAPDFQHGDAVLDPAMIARRGAKLGKNPKVITIYGGLHDLILSDKKVREAAYDSLFNFINTH
jgi:alpha-beta hydrolase superfamily lysophospholipase